MTENSRITHHPSPTTHHVSHLLCSLFLFALALLPRLPALDRFLTPDEFLWVDRSRNFLAGLTDPAYQCDSVVEQWQFVARGLACTLRTGHPGVTTMWTGSFGLALQWLADGRPGSLHDYVVAVSTNPLDARFIAPERLATVLLTSLWVAAVYWLARRLFGTPLALVGSVLIALDPFHIALSRVIHHDALSAGFMILSVLCAFIYWGENSQKSESSGQWSGGRGRNWRWLILSGLLAGFAFLSKLSSLYLMPFIALTGLWFTIQHVGSRPYGREAGKTTFLPSPHFLLPLLLEGLLWLAAALAVVFVFWPALWVAPLETIETAFSLGLKYTTGGHAKGNFLLGQVSQDPGPLFYPVTWLYRISPLVLIGVIAAPVAWALSWRRSQAANRPISEATREDATNLAPQSSHLPTLRAEPQVEACQPANPSASLRLRPQAPPAGTGLPAFPLFRRYLPLILLFILGYYLLMTAGEKKQDRYFLPAYPWLNFIAAAGLFWILDASRGFWIFTPHASRLTPHVSRLTSLILLILTINGYLVFSTFPYYLTYYNPLLGGIQGAAKAVTVGWGEGLDLAAAYLNQHTDPARTRVASWYESTFAPFYHGDSISYSKEKGKALAGDYVIFYINQTQRRFPDEAMFEYFETRFRPEKVITLQGLDYAWIYPSLGLDHYLEDQTYTGIASLLAWQWQAGDVPLIPGQPAAFQLYWEYLGKRPDEPFFFRLVDAQERLVAEAQSQPIPGESPPPSQWREGDIIAEAGALTLPPGTPPGRYRLHIGFYTHAPAVTEGELLFTIPQPESFVVVGHAPPSTYTLPAAAVPVNQRLGDSLTLLGATWPPAPSPQPPASVAIPLDLYWRIEKEIPADFAVHVGLMDAAGVARQAWFDLSLAETFEPAGVRWQPGDIIHTSWQLFLLPETPPGNYYFDLVLPNSAGAAPGDKLSFGDLTINPAEMSKN